MSKTKSTPSLESTLKSLDTEEFIDIHFYRPIGYQWALFFNKLGVSPNSITIASIFIGIAAVFIGTLTVAWQAFKASRMNPVDTIK